MSASCNQIVPDDDGSDLANLIRLGMAAIALQIQQFLDTGTHEYVMTAACPLDEAEAPQQRAEVVEVDVGIGAAVQNALQNLVVP
jgi:hypothetical protein